MLSLNTSHGAVKRGSIQGGVTLLEFLSFGTDMTDPLLILGIVLIVGSAGGWLAERQNGLHAKGENSESVL